MPSAIDRLEAGNRDHETAAVVALIHSKVVPAHRLSAYIERFGSAVRLVRLSEEDRLMSLEDSVHEVIGGVTPEGLNQATLEVSRWEDRGLTFCTVLDPEYPRNLLGIFNKPPLIFIEGHWDEAADSESVAVVGTRSASSLGLRRAAKLSRELVQGGFTVLSGLASGIDTAAHTAALDAGGRTVAVMGTGIDARYPRENAPLADRIVEEGGALISQFFPGQGPRQWTFPMRNVVMSGLSLGTVVVEASETSGAKMQARVALQHGRAVFLLRSLVEEHEWARKYVTEGRYDTHAIEISRTEEILTRYRPQEDEASLSLALA